MAFTRPSRFTPKLLLLTPLFLFAGASLPTLAAEPVTVYKNAQCGCCTKWVDHLKEAGFDVQAHNVSDLAATRQQLGMPAALASCHTARVGGYLIEGHVPASDLQRLLKEKPKALGLAVPGMPSGSPGMESPRPVPYNTLRVNTNGSTEVFARH